MDNIKSKIILEQSYADSLPEIVDYIILHDEQPWAEELSRLLAKAINDNAAGLKSNLRLADFYRQIILELRFICLPVLDDKEVLDLVKNNFCFQLTIPIYDFLQKINTKLLNIIIVDDRNKFKEALRQAILENNEKITPNHEIRLIRDWLKNYVASVGLDNPDKLVKAQYLLALKNNKNISSKEYENLSALFKFYDLLNIPSDSPQGLEEEPPVKINGRLFILRKGVLEPVPEVKGLDEVMRIMGENEESRGKNLMASTAAPISQPASLPSPTLADLEQALKNYLPASLEHKAISQEISRLKVLELKAAQKSDAKK